MREFKVNIGISSIILIVLVFALSAFAILSMKASNNEWKLAQRTAVSVSDYYQADTAAEEVLSKIDVVLQRSSEDELYHKLRNMSDLTKIGVNKKGIPQLVYYQVPVNKNADLKVKLTIQEQNNGRFQYQIQSWNMVNKNKTDNSVNIEDNNLWNGKIEE
jgi:hypothetical protein